KAKRHDSRSPSRSADSSGGHSDSPARESRKKGAKQERARPEDVHEPRSKWDSPERGLSHRQAQKQDHNPSQGQGQGSSRRRSRERDRDRRVMDRDRERDRDRDRDREREKEKERDQERNRDRDRDRERDRQRRSPDRRAAPSRSRSPRRERDFGRNRRRQRHNEDNEEQYEWGKPGSTDRKGRDRDRDGDKEEEPAEKEKPNFGLSGALTEDTNKVNGVVVKYSEPPEARKPKRRWRLYPFKGETALPTLHIHRQSCFLVGRDRKVVDLAVDHPSCSKQHAALQYRLVPFERDDGSQGKRVRLYLIDLESANGTFLNNKKIEGRKYYELIEKDVIKFGFSSREYVLLHENSKEDQEDDDVQIKEEPLDDTAPAPAAIP
ncbi:hypothetical protein KR018_008954, partial [Drosophila ironensis]